MSRETGAVRWLPVDPPGAPLERRPLGLDADAERLDAELRAAGARARLAGRGITQPTRFYARQLRSRLVASLDAGRSDE